jgi:hypothetical protein
MAPSRDDYPKPRSSFEFLSERYMAPLVPRLPAEHRPTAVLARQERQSMALARRGLRTAINDLLEMLRDLPSAELAECDRALEARGGYTLSGLRQRYSRHYARIVKQREIRNDEEYYLAYGIVSDVNLPLPKAERELLDRLVTAYGCSKS